MDKTDKDTPITISEDPDKSEENQDWLRILAKERKRKQDKAQSEE